MSNTADELQSSQELDAFYEKEDPWSYDTTVDDQRRLEALLDSLPRVSIQRTLDLGCGNGFVTMHLPGKQVSGVDLSPKAIEWARARAARIGKPIEFRVGSILDIDRVVDGRSFDLIVITGLLYEQYIGKAINFVSLKLDRILRENGHIVLVHIADWYKSGLPYRLIDRQIYPYRDRHHILEVYKK